MDFGWAFALLKNGRQIRRRAWRPDAYLVLKPPEGIELTKGLPLVPKGTPALYLVSSVTGEPMAHPQPHLDGFEILANDWELVEGI